MMRYIKREQFIWEFHNTGNIPSCYEKILFNDTEYFNTRATENPEEVIYVSLMPTYLNYILVNNHLYSQKKIKHEGKDGAGILIKDNYTIDSYLKEFTNKHFRANLNRSKKRLENSFNISYEYNFGKITSAKCSFLLKEFRVMLLKRFKEKNIENMFLNEWELNTKDLSTLINQKKASLFVIYNNEKPISISINSHIYGNILLSKTNAFDTDYTKFSLGHLDIYLLLNWCIENNYIFLDLGFGVPDYKRKWSNQFYDFDYHIYHVKKSPVAKLIAAFEISKIYFKNKIKNSNLIEYVSKLNSELKDFNKNDIKLENTYKQEILNNFTDYRDLKLINIYQPEFANLRRPLYDYLYSSQLHIDTIKIFKYNGKKHTYLIKSNKETVKISL